VIKSIELRNWKTHKNTKLDFSKGTNILIGQMGAGKSSLMDAISFALFGTFPAIQHKRVGVSRLIRNKPEQEKEAHVKLGLEINGESYLITRELDLKGKSTATIEKNGAYLQSQPERVTEEVERILKTDYDLFSKAVYSEQNQLDYFLDLRASERKKQIDGLLGLDRFATAQDNATSLLNRIRDMISDSERIAREFDIDKAASELQEMKSSLDMLRTEKTNAQEGVKAQKEVKSKLESEASSLKEMRVRKSALMEEIKSLKDRISLLEAEINKTDHAALRKKQDVIEEKNHIRSEIENLNRLEKRVSEVESNANKEIGRLVSEIDGARKDAAEKIRIDKELEKKSSMDIQKSMAECNSSIEKISDDLAHSRSIVSETEKQLKDLVDHLGKCPVCERAIDDQTKERIKESKSSLIREHAARLKTLEAELLKKRSELNGLTTLQASVASLQESRKRYLGAEERIKGLESRLSAAKVQQEKSKKERNDFISEINSANERLRKSTSELDAIERIERHTFEKERMSKELLAKSQACNAIAVDDRRIDEIEVRLRNAVAEMSRYETILDSAFRGIRDKEMQIGAKESEMARIRRIHDDVKAKKELVENLSKFKMALSETQSALRVKLINSINEVMHGVWKELYPYGDYESVILDASESGYELKVRTIVNNEHVWEDVEAIASGGERSTACLAMRVAFSLVLVPNLKWLILDEPTHNIDRQGLSKFVQMFSETLPSMVDQVFIITHDEMLKQVNDAKIYVLDRNKELNQETMVSQG
jgi:exonuclease SbcC